MRKTIDLGGMEGAETGCSEIPRDGDFSFSCAGCGDCCRKRRDLVLSGYDLDTGKVEICDPQKGKVQYDQSIFETRYKQLQSQAVTVVPVGGAVPVTTEPAG